MNPKNFLVLLSLSASMPGVPQKVLGALKQLDPKASPHWIDSRGAGICVSAITSALDLYNACFADALTHPERESMRDLAVLELGQDFHTRDAGSKLDLWLHARERAQRG